MFDREIHAVEPPKESQNFAALRGARRPDLVGPPKSGEVSQRERTRASPNHVLPPARPGRSSPDWARARPTSTIALLLDAEPKMMNSPFYFRYIIEIRKIVDGLSITIDY